MPEKSTAQEKLNFLISITKENLKLTKSLMNCINNISLDLNRKIDTLEKQHTELKNEIQKMDIVIHEKHIYSDEEIYKMKFTMSWKRLHEKTNIPLSTLQYRYRKYKNYLSEQGGNCDG